MPDKIAVLPHKATPLAAGDSLHACSLCGHAIKQVPGGSGPVWVHNRSGAVAGFPDLPTRRVVRGLIEELGPSPWGADELGKLANWLAALGFNIEESDESVEEYIAALAQVHARDNEWRCTDRQGRQLVVGQRVTYLGPMVRGLSHHQGAGSVTALRPGAPGDPSCVVVTDDEGRDITVNAVNVSIDTPGRGAP